MLNPNKPIKSTLEILFDRDLQSKILIYVRLVKCLDAGDQKHNKAGLRHNPTRHVLDRPNP